MIRVDPEKLDSTRLTEIGQRRHFKMCLLNKENQPISKYVKCKDYFNDVCWSIVNQQPIEIYGFAFDGRGMKLEDFIFRLLVSTDYDLDIKNLTETLNNYYAGFDFRMEREETGYIIEIPYEIFSYPASLSWFLYVIRNQDISSLLPNEEFKFLQKIYEVAKGSDFNIADGLLDRVKLLKQTMSEEDVLERFKKCLTSLTYDKLIKQEIHNESGVLAAFTKVDK